MEHENEIGHDIDNEIENEFENRFGNERKLEIENRIKEVYKDRNIPGSQGQRELYDFKDGEIKDLVNTIRTNYTSVIKKVAFYE